MPGCLCLCPYANRDSNDYLYMFPQSSEASLQVDTTTANLTVPEQGQFHLDCTILSISSQESRFAVSWFILKSKGRSGQTSRNKDGEEKEVLLRVGQDAIFSPEAIPWEGRLRFQRLSTTLYRLTVLQAGTTDGGNYSCRVEEWLPDPRGLWYKLSEEESGPISVSIQNTGEGIIWGIWQYNFRA